MSQTNNATATNLFEKVYGQLNDVLPEPQAFCEAVPFTSKEKVGESYSEGVVLTAETGITFGGTAVEAFNINPAIAGVVKQCVMTAYSTVLPSVIPWNAISRSLSSDQAFAKATAHVTDNNLSSHYRFIEAAALYGQSDALLGYVSYATATYRGISLTAGAGTIVSAQFGSLTFATGGCVLATKFILLAPGEFASGLWVGMEGVVVKQIDSTGAIVGQGSLVAVDAENGIIQVDFTPTVASSATSHRLCYDGMETAQEMPGAFKVMQNSATLFGISAATYALWKGTQFAVGAALLTFNKFGQGIAAAVNRGGLGGKSKKDGNVVVLVNPRTWHKLLNEQASLRAYDKSYSAAQFVQGAESLVFYHQAGKAEFVASSYMKEGYALCLHQKDWVRSGSAEIQMGVPGIDTKLLFSLENQAGMAFRSFADQYVFCRAPAKSILFTGINDEAAS